MDDSGSILKRQQGFILGVMAGDALGLPYEGLNRRRVAKILGPNPVQHRMIFGHGCLSDDSEHAVLTLRAWVGSGGDAERFRSRLSWSLRWWFLCLPPGVGLATAKACLRLWFGASGRNSGVRSAGNGPLMRSGVLGILCSSESELVSAVSVSTRVTHTHPDAVDAAIVWALAVRSAFQTAGRDAAACVFRERFGALVDNGPVRTAVERVFESILAGESTTSFADRLGCQNGVSGWCLHTLPVVLHAWLTGSDSFAAQVESIIRLGGDTDSTAALIASLFVAQAGSDAIPAWCLDGILDYPLNPSRFVHESRTGFLNVAPTLGVTGVFRVPRNLFFLIVVLVHGFRRMLPPF